MAQDRLGGCHPCNKLHFCCQDSSNFAVLSYRLSHCGTVEEWIKELYHWNELDEDSPPSHDLCGSTALSLNFATESLDGASAEGSYKIGQVIFQDEWLRITYVLFVAVPGASG